VPSFDDGQALMLACMEQSLEGVVSKKRNAPYRSGRGPTWIQVQDADVATGEQGSLGEDARPLTLRNP
jgi:ATP-dependent DNA ligase